MSWLSDGAVDRLRRAVAEPDFSGTRYELLEVLGTGGMGTVYRARDLRLDRDVAVKVLDPARGAAAERMLREARIIARLEHPAIVPIHDAGSLPDGRVWYAMRLVRGERLDRLVSEEASGARSLPERLRLFARICDAVAFAHAHGVVHRDLKPDNVMVGPFGEVLVMDWGVARVREPDGSASEGGGVDGPEAEPAGGLPVDGRPADATAHGTVLGTPGFMAPEQALGEVDRIDARADVYSLGAILWVLLAGGGDPPAGGGDAPVAPPGARRGSAVRPLLRVCRKALAADPEARYQSAAELGREVSRYLDGLPVTAYREGVVERLRRLGRRYRLAILLVLAYVAMRAAVLLWAGL